MKDNLYFSISELIYSESAIIHNINNMPDINSLDSLLNLIYFCLQPVRKIFMRPVVITSGYRCKELNSIVCGNKNSQHLKGEAADFIIKGIKPEIVISEIKASGIEFDQLINEYGRWIHISYRKGLNRQQILKY